MTNLDLSKAPGVTVQKIGPTGKIELHETETTTTRALRNDAEAVRGLVRLDLGKLHEASLLDPCNALQVHFPPKKMPSPPPIPP
jgi:hypothetical protein